MCSLAYLLSSCSFYQPFRLCPALKSIFLHGMRKPSILGGPCHPWLFLEEVSVVSMTDHDYFVLIKFLKGTVSHQKKSKIF